ncbi:protein AF-10-like isoform X3 [Pecten maximus]|uniref:protein AF-10-like isoform X3 n=1 Tax=Pecten maximus TaxID=6579 RepID=UPI001458385E|nr:protein AF-10-like isoform X3 [Pecten maximus]
MKEMVGGCCVCSDERGWAENPLVYCDGTGCNVAVHQACYGIVHVPTGPWFCRKCESQERTARVRCELCPQKDGALKRTDTGVSWCHVVCALFVPEAWFANVQTMEPIVLKNVPPERFHKTCYICEEHDRSSKANQGACMQCNKNGCKQNFHVTCAQAHGLLCEEAGNYGDNVKYCGYCAYHYKKLKKDANIKIIPAFKPIPADNATPDNSPEKNINSNKNFKKGNKAEAKYTSSELFAQQRESRSQISSVYSAVASGGGDAPKERETNTPPLSHSSGIGTSDSSAVSSTESPSMDEQDSAITDLAHNGDPKLPLVAEPKFMAPNSNDSSMMGSTSAATSSLGAPATSFSGVLENFVGGGVSVSRQHSLDDSVTEEDDDSDVMDGKRSRSRSLEKGDKKVKRLKQGQGSSGTKKVKSGSQCAKESSPPGTKKAKWKGDGTINSTAAGLAGMNSFATFGGSPYFQSLSAPSPLSLSSSFGPSSNMNAVIPDLDGSNELTGVPKMFPSLAASPSKQENCDFPTSLDQLLERQWEQGSQFLMQQGQHFDIASLLSCLHQLKSENKRLEDHIQSLTSRRDHLLAVNARLSLSYTPTNNINTTDTSQNSPRGSHEQSGRSSTSHSPIVNCNSPTTAQINPATLSSSALTVPVGLPNHTIQTSQPSYNISHSVGNLSSMATTSSIATASAESSQQLSQHKLQTNLTNKDNT